MAKNKKVIKEQKKLYQELQELYEEMRDFLSDVLDEQRRDSEELRYLKDFIHYQELEVLLNLKLYLKKIQVKEN